MADPLFSIAKSCADIALEAAVPIIEIYNRIVTVSTKADGSPVTEADRDADHIIRTKLQILWPDIPIISEESLDDRNYDYRRYFLVDPLDGTREFINRTGQFTVNIALIENSRAIMGVIYAPSQGELYIGADRAYASMRIQAGQILDPDKLQLIHVRDAISNHLVALNSLSHGEQETETYLNKITPSEVLKSGSSLKFCKLATGDADVYPRFGPTMAWDIAAGDAILRAAGGQIFNGFGKEFEYQSCDLKNGPFLAIGDTRLFTRLAPEFINICQNRHHAKNDIVE